MKIAACQTPEILGDVDTALGYVAAASRQAADVDLMLFPEAFLQGYLVEPDHVARHALDLRGRSFAAIRERLSGIRPTIVMGVLEREGDDFFNSAVVVDRGELCGVYRKTHLTATEASIFTPGREFPVFNMHGICFGLNICYDAQFPDAALSVRARGAGVLLLPAQNMMRRPAAGLWKDLHNTIRRIRVEETGMWLISADVTGYRHYCRRDVETTHGLAGGGYPHYSRDGERIGWGPTSAMSPDGRIVAQVPLDVPGCVTVQIDASSTFS